MLGQPGCGVLAGRFRKLPGGGVIGGVCGGLGHSTDLPSWAWRVIFCLTLLYFGVGLLIYILLWIFLPEEP